MPNRRKVEIPPMDNITETPVEELHEQIQMLQAQLEESRVREVSLGVELTEAKAAASRIADLEAKLRRARRGYISKKFVEKVIRSEIPTTWCADSIRVAKKHGLIGPDTMDI